ncbi:MAG TPA: response regulator [Vicinamibacterales bacterium]|nr:response regulator [Vicinamibacterales bacterium]
MSRRVLIIEDDPDTREMLGHFLELSGFVVETAANGREALDTLRGGDYASVILLDLMMPVMDGWEFRAAQRLDPALSAIPVIVVTAAGPRERVPPIDADAWLPKPIDLDQLLDTIAPFC